MIYLITPKSSLDSGSKDIMLAKHTISVRKRANM